MTARAPGVEPIVSVQSLDKSFLRQRGWGELLGRPFQREHVPALRSVSLDIYPGELFGLLGPNGAGKTTLFKILATLLLPDRGQVTVAGLDVTRAPGRVRETLTPVIAGERSLFWRLSALENLRLFAGLYGLARPLALRRAREILAVVGLEDAGDKLVGTFSSGMKQRLLIGRALLGNPRVLLLDEPTRSLDPLGARDLRRFLREELHERRRCTVLLATHNAEEALELCTRVGVLDRGRLLAVGTVEELREQVGDERYRLVAEPEAEGPLRALMASGLVTRLEVAEPDGSGFGRFDVSIPGGRRAAASVLTAVSGAGVPVAHFERVALGLADLVERVMAGSATVEAEARHRSVDA